MELDLLSPFISNSYFVSCLLFFGIFPSLAEKFFLKTYYPSVIKSILYFHPANDIPGRHNNSIHIDVQLIIKDRPTKASLHLRSFINALITVCWSVYFLVCVHFSQENMGQHFDVLSIIAAAQTVFSIDRQLAGIVGYAIRTRRNDVPICMINGETMI